MVSELLWSLSNAEVLWHSEWIKIKLNLGNVFSSKLIYLEFHFVLFMMLIKNFIEFYSKSNVNKKIFSFNSNLPHFQRKERSKNLSCRDLEQFLAVNRNCCFCSWSFKRALFIYYLLLSLDIVRKLCQPAPRSKSAFVSPTRTLLLLQNSALITF